MFTKLAENAIIPTQQHQGDAGWDLHATAATHLKPGEVKTVGTGVKVDIPAGHVGLVCPRSGLAANHSVTVLNAPGIIDAGYTGEIQVILVNHGHYAYQVLEGDRVAQLVILPTGTPGAAEEKPARQQRSRGKAGLGSTGK